jgi:putative ABC transport system permease protein
MLSAGFVGDRIRAAPRGLALVRAVQPLRYSRSFALRQAVLHIARPGNQTRVILLAVGLGTFFILGVRTLQANLLQDFAVQVGEDAPDMFLIDIQAIRRTPAAFIDSRTAARRPQRHPGAARAHHRRARTRGQPRNVRAGARPRLASREYTITYRPQLNATRSCSRASGGTRRRRPARRKCRSKRALQERFRINIGDRDAVRRARAHDPGARDEHPQGELARLSLRAAS